MRVSKEAEMETLSRWAASLAMAGGALFVVVLLIVAFSPTSPVWYGFLVGIVLLGAAVVGLYRPRDEVLAAEPPRPHDMTGKPNRLACVVPPVSSAAYGEISWTA